MKIARRLALVACLLLPAAIEPSGGTAAEKPTQSAGKHRRLELPRFTVQQVQEFVAEVAPHVERVLQRKFRRIPPVVVDDTEAIARLLAADMEPTIRKEQPSLGPEEVARMALASGRETAPHLLGKYGIKTGILGLRPADLGDVIDEHRIDPSHATGIFKTIIAHELTHALQAQHVDILKLLTGAKGEDASAACTAVIEGQAMFVQERVGEALGLGVAAREYSQTFSRQSRTADMVQRVLTARQEFTYIEGRRFVAWHFEQGGAEQLWEVLARPPATTAMIARPESYRAASPARPDLSGVFASAAKALAAKGWRVEERELGEIDLRAVYAAADRDAVGAITRNVVAARALGAHAPQGHGTLQVILFVLADEPAGARMIDLLRAPLAAEAQAAKGRRAETKKFERTELNLEADASAAYTLHAADSHGRPLLDKRVFQAARGSVAIEAALDSYRMPAKEVQSLLDGPLRRAAVALRVPSRAQ